jgi:predicted phage tail protein
MGCTVLGASLMLGGVADYLPKATSNVGYPANLVC